MKKIIVLFYLLIIVSVFSFAQNVIVKGIVTDEKGSPLSFALVQDKQIKSGVYTDSLGRFNISVRASSILLFSSHGYQTSEVNIDKQNSLQVVLKHGVNKEDNPERNTSINTTIDDAVTGHTSTNPQYNQSNSTQGGQAKFNGSSFPIRKEKEATKGSRYFFATWANGIVVDTKNKEIKDASYLFNYDKISGNLLLTHDQQSAIEVNKDQIKSFTLIDKTDNTSYIFKMVPDIDEVHFVQIISEGPKYSIYKAINTKFIPANYSTNGLSSSGNQYDEYANENAYYVLNMKTKEIKKISLKKKSIKEAFGDDQAKLNSFPANGSIDEQYLKNLSNYMNS